jgi:hypothetical protein
MASPIRPTTTRHADTSTTGPTGRDTSASATRDERGPPPAE